MSDAAVKFWTMDWEPAGPGQEAVMSFACPKHAGRRCEGLHLAGRCGLPRDPQGKNGGVAQWDFDGNREVPTFSPSVNCGGCWHGYIRNGRCVDVNGRDDPEPAPK